MSAETDAIEAGETWARGFAIVVPYDARVIAAAREWGWIHRADSRTVKIFIFAATSEIERRRGTYGHRV